MTIKYPLMRSNFSRSDLDAVIEHLKQDDPIAVNSRKSGVIGLAQNIQFLLTQALLQTYFLWRF
jgi:uncharacterized protein YpbB